MRLIDKLLRPRPTPIEDNGPQPGNIYAFETTPLSEFANPDTKRFAAIKFLGVSDRLIVIGVLDRIWTNTPDLRETRNCGMLKEHRFRSDGRHAVFGTNRDWWPSTQLRNVQFLGRTRVNSDELELARLVMAGAPGTRF